MRKIFTDFPIKGTFALSADDAHHVLVVLRHTVGDRLRVTDSEGATYECLITAMEGHAAVLTPVQKISDGSIRNGEVILAAGLLKGDKFDWVIQKATELGVSRIIPVQMRHCVVKLNEARRRGRWERWNRIAAEAAKQCGRDDIPPVEDVMDFPALVQTYQSRRFVIPYERETAPFHAVCQDLHHGDLVLCIGPEGGFAEEEIQYASTHASWCHTVSLGPRILRAETASLAALAIIMYERGFK
ncbi:16S rRNA (uracil(1498)-N(3))-methyltransferase [uncultured Megasphaera sp.]|uniref:RsmE family RNA methyltransferase n=1 Tax=uncultured Megasphaera sp. TaxID=165188 RepID=UPI002658075E|nr:RsmE family RNA methyltransferase [uncultured Megasphaera sp.]